MPTEIQAAKAVIELKGFIAQLAQTTTRKSEERFRDWVRDRVEPGLTQGAAALAMALGSAPGEARTALLASALTNLLAAAVAANCEREISGDPTTMAFSMPHRAEPERAGPAKRRKRR